MRIDNAIVLVLLCMALPALVRMAWLQRKHNVPWPMPHPLPKRLPESWRSYLRTSSYVAMILGVAFWVGGHRFYMYLCGLAPGRSVSMPRILVPVYEYCGPIGVLVALAIIGVILFAVGVRGFVRYRRGGVRGKPLL